MRIVYMGTPDFAVPCLERILEAGHEVLAVFTQPDKPKGRGYTLTPPPVKVCAQSYGIEVFQPKTLKDGEAVQLLKEIAPDAVVVVAYGKILPKEILELPPLGCINVHASLLPKYRGAAPIQWSVLNGEKETGVTVMYMDQGLDTGDMLMKATVDIGPDETAGELHDRLSAAGARLLVKALAEIENGTAKRERQDESLTCYSPMLDKTLCKIDWGKKAQQVHNQVRGLNPWPVAISSVHGKNIKIFGTRVRKEQGKAGEVLSCTPLIVACGEGSVELTEVQLEGKKKMSASDFLRGHQLKPGEMFL